MAQVYYTSDLHLQHKAICKYRPRFSTPEEHDEYMLSLFDKLPKRSLVYILGDFLFTGPKTDEYLARLGKLPYQIKLIMGNHDIRNLHEFLPPNITLQLPLCTHKGNWLTHAPIHPNELRNRNCIHGHLHLETLNDPHYFNVNVDVNSYEFVTLDTVRDYFDNTTKLAPSALINHYSLIPKLLGLH